MYLLWRSVLLFVVYTIYLVDYSLESNKRVVFLNFERPYITYENPKYLKIYNLTSTRIGRHDPVHYIEICAEAFTDLDNSIMIWMKFYEFLSNDYKPTFVQIHFKLCDYLRFVSNQLYKSKNISIPVTHFEPDLDICHEEPGIYCINNISVPVAKIPQVFPFEKGRTFFNITKGPALMASGYLDVDVKMMPVTKAKNRN